MKNVAAIIESYLTGNWAETDPADPTYKYDEYDPKNPQLQVLLENLPDKKTWISPNQQKVEHKVRLTLFLKPVRYDATTIEADKTTFTNAKTEIDRILIEFKFIMEDFRNIVQGGWDDKDTIQRGYGQKGNNKEPIQFRSINMVTVTYFVTNDSYTTEEFPFIYLS